MEEKLSSYQDTRKLTRTISITSGKGGVGKSTIAANLALQIAQTGKRVLLLDGDFTMANLDIMFSVRTNDSVESVLLGAKELKDIIMNVHPGVDLIPGGSGIYSMSRMSVFQKRFLMDQIAKLEGVYDYLIIDTAPGIDEDVLYLNSSADEVSIVLTPDPASVLDAYALIKVLNSHYKEVRFSILTNLVKDEKESIRLFKAVSDMAEENLLIHMKYLGFIPYDLSLRHAVKQRKLISLASPKSASSLALARLSKNMTAVNETVQSTGGLKVFWQQILNVA